MESLSEQIKWPDLNRQYSVLRVFSTQEVDACHLLVPVAKHCHFQARVIWYTFISKGRDHDYSDDRRVCKCRREDASPWALCVCACLFPELTNCMKVNSGAPASIVMLSPTHSHTPFPWAHNTQYWVKMKKGAKPCMRQRLPIQIKTANPLSFLSLSLDMFLKATEAHCVPLPLLSCV